MYPAIKRVMIGRGLLKDPFLAEKITGQLPSNGVFDKDRFLAFHNELYLAFEEKFRNRPELLGKMKDYWRFFSHQFKNRNEVFKYISRSKDILEFNKRMDEILNDKL
jgi:tRNA-dihydrouridine synthase